MSRRPIKKFIEKNSFDAALKAACRLALKEDKAHKDVTSDAAIKNNQSVSFKISAREDLVLCGINAIHHCFDELTRLKKFHDIFLGLQINAHDGDLLKSGETIATGFGDAKLIFAAERVILNLLQHLSGIATATNTFVKTLDNDKIKILDTRKTLPGLRDLQKHAVLVGGGQNHRHNLSDRILIKDNHIAAAGSVTQAINLAKKAHKNLIVEVECDNFEQVVEAVKSGPDIIMLDNMNKSEVAKCSKIIRAHRAKKILIEISGGINLSNVKNFRTLDIDFISIGSLTHSVKAVDIGLDILL